MSKWSLTVWLVSLVLACSGKKSTLEPTFEGDECAVWVGEVTCQAHTPACEWVKNTRPCTVNPDGGSPNCPSGFCYSIQPPAELDGGVAARCACQSGKTCVEVVGAQDASVAVTCELLPAGCTADNVCDCGWKGLSGCYAPTRVSGLCVCESASSPMP